MLRSCLAGVHMGGPLGRSMTQSPCRVLLAAQLPCRGACGAQYCSASCEASAWELHHRLLCPSPGAASTLVEADAGTQAGTAAPVDGVQAEPDLASPLQAFFDHARKTNEIFILVAKV